MVYLDELFIFNFIIDYILLITCKYIVKLSVKRIRILLSCLFGEVSMISLIIEFNGLIFIIFKVLICFLMIYIAYGYNDLKSFIKNVIYFYILNFFLGGILFYLKSSEIINYKIVLLLIPIIMKIYKYFAVDIKNIFSSKYRVTIYLNNGKILYLNGFMDTGNSLIEPYSNRKVIIINKKIEENYYLVPYKTVDSVSLIKCFNPKKVYIDGIGERDDISIGITNQKFVGFNCLLNYKLLEA